MYLLSDKLSEGHWEITLKQDLYKYQQVQFYSGLKQ
jgi:hypothetical protein